MRILLVEDERALADGIVALLKKNGYETDSVYDGEAGTEYFLTGIYDLVILDIMLPLKNGLDVLREARNQGISTPVLLLTAKSERCDIVRGLDSGADDYLTKPFDREELLARLRALLRRENKARKTAGYCFGDLGLETEFQTLRCHEKAIRLRGKEYFLMEALFHANGRIVAKETLYLKAWGFNDNSDYNNVEVYVSFLRKKLSELGSLVKIQSARGQGYFLEEYHG